MRLDRDSAERIRRREVSRALKKVDLSPEVEEVIKRMSRSLVDRLLHGPISRVMVCAEVEICSVGRRSLEASSGLKRHRGGAESPTSETNRVSGSSSHPDG